MLAYCGQYYSNDSFVNTLSRGRYSNSFEYTSLMES
jgi:hypothetical protein